MGRLTHPLASMDSAESLLRFLPSEPRPTHSVAERTVIGGLAEILKFFSLTMIL